MGFLYSQFLVTPEYPKKSFAGQTVIVTGSNVGLGKEAARHFARVGVGKLILAVRNTQGGEQAKSDIVSTTKVDPSTIEVWKLDLGSYESVKEFAKRASNLPRIDVLIENAGIATEDFKLVEGHESTVTVNVVSTFLLALLMLPKLKEVARQHNVQPRLVIVTSEVHSWTKFPEGNADKVFAALDDPSSKTMGERYPTSKLLEILTVRQIAPKLENSGVILNMLNPGFCHSSLVRETSGLKGLVVYLMKLVLARTTEVGGRTLFASAAADEKSHGKYMHDGKVGEEHLSSYVTSEKGRKQGEKVWSELKQILEDIEPGVTGNL